MTRDSLIQKWAEILRLERTGHAPDGVRALGLLDELATVLEGKVLLLDDGTALYEDQEQGLVVVEIFHDLV